MRIKVVVVGEADVGKTCIVQRAYHGKFPEEAKPTIGAGNVVLEINADNQTVILNIWDTAGQEKYRSLTQMYFSGASVGILVFDLTSRKSFDVLPEFVTLLKEKAGEKVQMVLVGNKADISERVIDEDIAENYAHQIGASFYIETSAKTGFRIDELFQRIAKLSITSEEKIKQLDNPVFVQLDEDKKNKRKCC